MSRFAGRAGWRRRVVVIGALGGLTVPLALAMPASATPAYAVTATITVGSDPTAAAVDPATNTVYVTNIGAGTVSVINGVSNAVTHTITVGSQPQYAAVDPATNTIYVTNGAGNSVSVINGATNAVTATIPVGTKPIGVAVDPATDTIYVTDSRSNAVSVINGKTNAVTATVGVGDFPGAVDVNPVTDTVYVSNADDPSVSVINGATNAVTATITTVGGYPSGVGVDAATNTVYVSNENSGTVSVINGASNAVTHTITVGSKPIGMAVDAENDTIFATNTNSASLSVISGATNAVTATVTVGNTPYAVGVNPNTGIAYTANGGDSTVSVISGPSAPSCATAGPVCSMNGTAVITGGSLTVQAPPAIHWADQLTGVNQQVASGVVSPAVNVYTVADATGTKAGWSVAVSATPFVGIDTSPDANTLPGALVFDASDTSPTATVALDAACASGSTCTTPTNSVSYPQDLTAGSGIPTQIVNAAVGTGVGSVLLGQADPATFWLSIPGNTAADTYDSTITVAVSSGPSGF